MLDLIHNPIADHQLLALLHSLTSLIGLCSTVQLVLGQAFIHMHQKVIEEDRVLILVPSCKEVGQTGPEQSQPARRIFSC